MKTRPEFLKYRNLFQRYTNPGLKFHIIFSKALRKMHERLGPDFIEDRDEILNEDIISVTASIHFDKLHDDHLPVISNLAKYFECKAICFQYLNSETKVTRTIRVVGYQQDALICTHIIEGLVNSSVDMRNNLQSEFRRLRLNKRRTRGKDPNELPSRVKASNIFYMTLDNILVVTKEILEDRNFGVLKHIKAKLVDKAIMKMIKLDFKYPNAKEHKIEYAYTTKFKLNRILK